MNWSEVSAGIAAEVARRHGVDCIEALREAAMRALAYECDNWLHHRH